MPAGHTLVIRLLGLLLLVLTVSPVTAPFSACDLFMLFGDATAPAASSIQSKKAPEEPASVLENPRVLRLTLRPWLHRLPGAVRGPQSRPVLDLPLRL